MVDWPTGLPIDVVEEGTGIGRLTQSPIRTEMEDGPGRARRRTTATWSEVTIRLCFTHAQFLTFQAFHRDTLDHGASRFNMQVWKPGLVAPYPVKAVRFADDPKVEAAIPWTYVTLPLLVRDY